MTIAHWRARLVVAAFLVPTLALVLSESATAQVGGIKMVAPADSQWEVLAGYNTATHEGVDPYALDLWRVDDETGGTPLLAPFSGSIGYSSDTCVSIRTDAVNLLMCHVYVDGALEQGDDVVVGQRIGTVAPDGAAENNGIAHIHLQLNVRSDAPGSTGDSIPFSGAYAIEGVDLEATTDFNAHSGRRFTSTNSPSSSSSGGPSVDAGVDRTVAPREVVTLSAQTSGVSDIVWVQQAGPAVVTNIAQGATFTFVAPAEAASLSFQAVANVDGSLISDSVEITVEAPAAPPEAAPPQASPPQAPSIIGGQVFHGGISMVVFSGGSTDELISAAACPMPQLAMWASAPNGNLVQYTVDRPAFVNASWAALFPTGLPGLTPLLIRCE